MDIKQILKYIIFIVGLILIMYLVGVSCRFVTTVKTEIKGALMEPTFHNGQSVQLEIFTKYDRKDGVALNYNDIVVFNNKNEQLIKRIVGVPGDSRITCTREPI